MEIIFRTHAFEQGHPTDRFVKLSVTEGFYPF